MIARRKVVRIAIIAAGVVLVAAAAYGAWLWATYPSVPDVMTAELREAIFFIGSDDFPKMFESHKKRYVNGIVQRLRQMPLHEMVGMMMQGRGGDMDRMRKVGQNWRSVRDREELEGNFLAMFLDKFYEQPEDERTTMLKMFINMQPEEARRQQERMGLPSIEQLKNGMARFMSRQPPKVQAKMSQLMLDMRRTRESMGLKDPWDQPRS